MSSVLILRIENIFLFPKCDLTLSLDDDLTKKIIFLSLKKNEGKVLIIPWLSHNAAKLLDKKNDKDNVGVLAKIKIVLSPNLSKEVAEDEEKFFLRIRKIKLFGLQRVKITEIKKKNIEGKEEIEEAKYESLSDKIEEGKGLQVLTEKLARSISEIIERSSLSSLDVSSLNEANAIEIIDFIAHNSKEIDNLIKLKILNEPIPEKRLQILINLPNKKKIEGELDEQTKKNIRKDQETYFLVKKKEAIEKKLRESRGFGFGNEEIKKILDRLEKEPFPTFIKELIYQKIEQLEMSPNGSTEGNVIKTYINWVISIPWYQKTKEINDIELARKKLDEKHYGLVEVKERVIEYLASVKRAKKTLGQIICLLGPPGVGKTSLAASIAEATGRKFVSISVGGVSDESEIRGHRSTYIGAYPGRIVKALIKSQSKNPLILIDEIDKIGHSYRGDPAYALLEVLDTSTNEKFIDNYLGEEAPCDLSEVFFICTANYYYDIPLPLLDRLEVIKLSSYTLQEKMNVAKDYIIPEFKKKYNLIKDEITFTDEALKEIIDYYTRESGVRKLKEKIDSIFRKFIVKTLSKENKKEKLLVDNAIVQQYLKKKIYNFTKNKKFLNPGIFNGLVYMSFGSGDILPIEVTYFYKEKGDSDFTGNLGNVMKESCRVALSYIRSNAEKFGIDPKFFSQHCIHINAVEGAVPKDGPSAGVALTTAIISAITKKVIPEYYGATGEISLNGWVGEIGGLREKAIGAQRGKLKTIFVPKDNEKDFVDIPEEVRNELEIVFVENYEEVWRRLFLTQNDQNDKENLLSDKKDLISHIV